MTTAAEQFPLLLDITHVKDVSWRGPLPGLLAPYVALYGPLHVYADDVTGHLFVRAGSGGEVAGAEQFFALRPSARSNSAKQTHARAY